VFEAELWIWVITVESQSTRWYLQQIVHLACQIKLTGSRSYAYLLGNDW
jgi:hypothetical protein